MLAINSTTKKIRNSTQREKMVVKKPSVAINVTEIKLPALPPIPKNVLMSAK